MRLKLISHRICQRWRSRRYDGWQRWMMGGRGGMMGRGGAAAGSPVMLMPQVVEVLQLPVVVV